MATLFKRSESCQTAHEMCVNISFLKFEFSNFRKHISTKKYIWPLKRSGATEALIKGTWSIF
jgi:hypothetical protein